MNPILAEIQRLAPGYEPDASQRGQIARHSDPEGFARILEGRMNDVREDAVRYLSKAAPDLGITADDITNHDAIAGIRAFHSGGISGADKKQFEGIGAERTLRMGIRIGQRRPAAANKSDKIEMLYLAILDRPSKPGGHAYWSRQNRAGMSIQQIAWHIANSPEARGR